jgi:hypothetical protein
MENHRATLMHRLGLQNQAELIRHAIRRGLIPMDESEKTLPLPLILHRSPPPQPAWAVVRFLSAF